MGEPIDIIETNDHLTAEQADEIQQAWLKTTGRRCVVLSGGRYAGTVEAQGE